jgi:hypothetical protein
MSCTHRQSAQGGFTPSILRSVLGDHNLHTDCSRWLIGYTVSVHQASVDGESSRLPVHRANIRRQKRYAFARGNHRKGLTGPVRRFSPWAWFTIKNGQGRKSPCPGKACSTAHRRQNPVHYLERQKPDCEVAAAHIS